MIARLLPDSGEAGQIGPFVVVEGGTDAVAAAVSDAIRAGWRVDDLGAAAVPADRATMWRLEVDSAGAAAKALDAALSGAALLVRVTADRGTADALCEDLRRLGSLEQRRADAPRPAFTAEEYALIDLLAEGCSLGDAAARLCISRRTADRRLAAVKDALGVTTTAEAVLASRSTVPPPAT